jgi:hypothetical protein
MVLGGVTLVETSSVDFALEWLLLLAAFQFSPWLPMYAASMNSS